MEISNFFTLENSRKVDDRKKQKPNCSELFELISVSLTNILLTLLFQYLKKKSGEISHLSDDEDEELVARAKIADQKKADKQKLKADKQKQQTQKKDVGENLVVKLKNIPPSVSRVRIGSSFAM